MNRESETRAAPSTGVKLIAGVVVLAVLALLAQNFVFGDDSEPDLPPIASFNPGATATIPAQLPDPAVLGQISVEPPTPAPIPTAVHVIQPGETLNVIAANLGVAAADVPAWISLVTRLNDLIDPAFIQVGQELFVPVEAGDDEDDGPPPPDTTPTPTPTPSPPAATYQVEPGDTSFGIANKFCIAVHDATDWLSDLVAINGIDPDNLSVGQVLELPAGTPEDC